MNFNHPWNGGRGRNRGNRGSGRNWRGGHYRGGSHFHRAVPPPLLNSDNYYSPNRFRSHENFSNYYAHSPVSQNDQWNPRNRPALLSNPRQSFLPISQFTQQNSSRSLSPLPGSEEYMERNISEKSALLKRELELEGSTFIGGAKDAEGSVDDGNFQTDSTNNNLFENTKEADDGKCATPSSEVTQSPRRTKKQKPISQSVEEIHQKIINHISNLSYNKKMNLVNFSGPSGYDIAIQEITRQKRMELSKVLRDMCHNKFKETDDSSLVINAIIPDFDIKIEELPREVVEQLSSTLDEDVTERLNMCIDPELMFQQAAEMLNTTLDIEKSVDDGEEKVEFNPDNFLKDDNMCNILMNDDLETKEPTIADRVVTPTLENCQLPTFTFDMPEPLVFDIPSPVIPPQPLSPEPEFQNIPKPVEIGCSNANAELYSPGHESSNSNSLPANVNLMDIPEPADIPVPPMEPIDNGKDDPTDENPAGDSDLLDLNNRDKISFNLNKRVLLKNEEFDGNSSTKDDEEKSQASVNESHIEEEKVEEPPKAVEEESGKEHKDHKSKEHKKDNRSKSKEESVAKVERKEDSPAKKVGKDRKSKGKAREEDEEIEKKKQEKKTKSRHEGEDSQRATEKDERAERRQRDKYNAAETSRLTYDDEVVERRKDKKGKSKYDEEYYSSKYERGMYQGQSYEEGYRKRYRESPVVDEDKHRRSDHDKNFDRYRELEADVYHYSKYPVDVDEGRNSKRYYHEKSSYRQEYDYPYNKYDYPSSEYYQRSELYPSEDYEQKLQYSKTHKNKYKRHPKKHKRHRDRSSDSNVSSSGSEKNSSTSSLKTINKHASKQTDLYDSSEEGVVSKAPKTTLMERLQVLCDTKLGGIKLEPVSPNPNENEQKRPNSSNETDEPTHKDINQLPKEAHPVEQTVPHDTQSNEKSVEAATQKEGTSNAAIESVSLDAINAKNRSESEDDLKCLSEIESFESKNYRQRPWKSPGEKKFMMEHLNQNATNEDGLEIGDVECRQGTPPLPESLINPEVCGIDGAESQPYEMNELPLCSEISKRVDDFEKSKDVSVENKIVPIGRVVEDLQIPKKILVTACTQTIADEVEELVVETKESKTTQTIDTNSSTASTQTQVAKVVQTLTQTDHVIIVDNVTETAEVDDNVPKSSRCKQFIDRMYEIDKEIDRLIKLRQSFYHLFANVSDPGHSPSEIKDTKNITSSSKSLPKAQEVKRNTPTPSIPERGGSRRRTHTTSHHKTSHGSKTSHHRHEAKTGTPEPSKQKTAPPPPPPKERSKRAEPKSTNVVDKPRSARSTDTQKNEKKEAESAPPPKSANPSDEGSSKVQQHGRGRPRKNQPQANSEKLKKEEHAVAEEKKEKASLREKTDGGRKRKLKKDEVVADVEAKRPKKVEVNETSSVEKEVVVDEPAPVEPAPVVPAPVVCVEPEEKVTDVPEETKPEDSVVVEDDKPSEVEIPEATVQVDKDVTVVDDGESLAESEAKVQTENKLNGSFVAEDVAEEKEEVKADLVVENPVTPVAEENVPILTSSESSTPSPKKKKRRLSGMMAEYRKKKKKSKKSKKKDEKSVVSKRVESSVKITRFSLEQLETMRDSIRGKHVSDESLSENSLVSEPDATPDAKPMEAADLDEIAHTASENVPDVEPDPVTDESINQTSYSIDFKGFTGAILVIKVIGNTVLAASDKGQLLSFDLLNGELINTVNISTLAVTSLIVTSTNDITTVYVGSLDMHISIFNFQTNEIVKQETVSEPVQCMEHSWNFIFVGSDRGTLIRFDIDTQTVMDQTKISDTNILMMKAYMEGPRKILVVATRNSAVSIRDALSGLLLRTMETSFLPTVYTLLIDKNLVYCGTSQHGILVYTFEDGQLALQHEATKSKGVVCMQIVGNLLFAGCYNGNIYVYNKKTNAYLGTMNGPGGLMLSMEIVDDKIIVGTKSSNFKAWKIPQEYYEEK